jgi:hypothetical protein
MTSDSEGFRAGFDPVRLRCASIHEIVTKLARIELFRRLNPAMLRGISVSVQRLKSVVAVVLALVWLPAVSCCWLDASGLLGEQDCCAKEHSQRAPTQNGCDKPCGTLASVSYFPQQTQLLVIAPVSLLLCDCEDLLTTLQSSVRITHDFPTTAPPELAGHWQFFFRAASSPRAPSFAS